MIPPDVASSLRQLIPDREAATTNLQTQPVPAAQRIADVLSNFVPGERILAQIQALLPNGTYRAVVAQRDVTLALPFSAKAGDTLELEVAESDGKLTLAFVANRTEGPAARAAPESVTTSLSTTGKVIGDLLNELSGEGKRAPPAPLNGNQALVETMPRVAATDLAPVLQQALSKSGMFYEAHQARWVAGELPVAQLREEPQGKLPPTIAPPLPLVAPEATEGAQPPLMQSAPQAEATLANKPEAALAAQASAASPADSSTETVLPNVQAGRGEPGNPGASQSGQANQASQANQSTTNTQSNPPANPVARELAPIVQQQLDALATQNYAWQGQIWPGQKLWWEISADPDESRSANAEGSEGRWQTRLKLSLPSLGGIDATLHLRSGGKIEIAMTADTAGGESRLKENLASLQEHLKSAGIDLTQIVVQHGEAAQ